MLIKNNISKNKHFLNNNAEKWNNFIKFEIKWTKIKYNKKSD